MHAIIIEESLANKEILEKHRILRTKFLPPPVSWRLHIVELYGTLDETIAEIQYSMVSDKPFYFHIYDEGETLIVVFKNNYFTLDPNNKITWMEAKLYGSKLNIPAEQLDFYPTRISEEEVWFNSPDQIISPREIKI